MNKKILIALPLCLVGFDGTSPVTAQDVCKLMEVLPVCQEDARQITINKNSMNVSPPNFCATAGGTIEVRITPTGTMATLRGKTGGWPNDSGTSITLNVPAAGSYDYYVHFEDGSCIDPRITVRD